MKMVRKFICVLLAALLSAMLLGGCGQNSGDSEYDIFEGYRTDEIEEDTWSFYGCWEYQNADQWLYIHNDGSYEWYDEGGLDGGGSYYVEDGVLYLQQDDLSFGAKFGGLVDSNDNVLFSSRLPDYDGSAMSGAENFIGCWEDTMDNVWLDIYSDGTYLFMWDDGFGSERDCYMDGEELCLQSGTRFSMDYETGMIVSDDYTMFRSEMPNHLR